MVVSETRVPAALPAVLKEYTKAAIRTQPRDLITWSAAYFRALMQHKDPPVKDRLEFPIPEADNGVSPGVLRVLHRQLQSEGAVSWRQVKEACQAMGVGEETVQEAWKEAGGTTGALVEWDHILSHLASLSTHSTLEALQLVMAAVTDDPVGRRVESSCLLDHYHRLHNLPPPQLQEVTTYLADLASYQGGYILPSDLTRPSCPPV